MTGALFVLSLCFGSGLVIGLVAGNRDAYHRRYLEERSVLMPVVAGDPAFSNVGVEERSDGGAYLLGDVPTPDDLNRLRGLVMRALGESRARDAMLAIDVRRSIQQKSRPAGSHATRDIAIWRGDGVPEGL